LWGPRAEPDARTQDESLFQVLDAIGGDSGQCQSPRHDDLHRDWLRADEAAHAIKGAPILHMAQNVELQPRHRLKRPIVMCRVSPLSRT